MRYLTTNPKTALFCLGCLSALAMAPLYFWPIMMIGYSALLVMLIKAENWKTASSFAFVFFFGFFLASLYWVSSSLFVDFDKWWWALPFSFAGLPFLLALFPAILIGLAKLTPKYKTFTLICAIAVADIARGSLFTGFPWNMPVHGFVNHDFFMLMLPMLGFYGLNTLLIFFLITPAFMPSMRGKAWFIVIVALHGLAPLQKIQSSQIDHNVVMVQANIPQTEKWRPEYIWRNFNRYVDMSRDAIQSDAPHIIIWPETAISQNFLSHPTPQAAFQDFLKSMPDRSILISGHLNFKNDKAYNSITVFDKNAQILAQYDKHHLVPFGEYMPFGLDTITGFSNFSAGKKPEPIHIKSPRISFLPLICYESIFTSLSKNSRDSDFILQLTNDAWFGQTAGPYQHFDHARLRAIESQKPLIRLSAVGISGIINGDGVAHKIIPLNTQDTLIHNAF